jgi:colicin import membrane protein
MITSSYLWSNALQTSDEEAKQLSAALSASKAAVATVEDEQLAAALRASVDAAYAKQLAQALKQSVTAVDTNQSQADAKRTAAKQAFAAKQEAAAKQAAEAKRAADAKQAAATIEAKKAANFKQAFVAKQEAAAKQATAAKRAAETKKPAPAQNSHDSELQQALAASQRELHLKVRQLKPSQPYL